MIEKIFDNNLKDIGKKFSKLLPYKNRDFLLIINIDGERYILGELTDLIETSESRSLKINLISDNLLYNTGSATYPLSDITCAYLLPRL